MVDIAVGSILVDGVNLQDVDLDTLRWQLSAIPQDSLLFTGKMRNNLDPMGLFTDAQMNEALGRCGLIATPGMSQHEVTRLEKFKLDSDVALNGKNFSYEFHFDSKQLSLLTSTQHFQGWRRSAW